MKHSYQFFVQDSQGNIQPNSTVEVRRNGSLVQIYSDTDGTPKQNPFQADSNAYALFYADSATYDITATFGGGSVEFVDVGIGAVESLNVVNRYYSESDVTQVSKSGRVYGASVYISRGNSDGDYLPPDDGNGTLYWSITNNELGIIEFTPAITSTALDPVTITVYWYSETNDAVLDLQGGLITYFQPQINDAIASITGENIGLYGTNPTYTNYNQYATYDRAGSIERWYLNSDVPLDYLIDSATYPDPADDPNLHPSNDQATILQVIARIESVQDSQVAYLSLSNDLISTSYLYDLGSQKIYFSSVPITGEITSTGIDLSGVRTIQINSVDDYVIYDTSLLNQETAPSLQYLRDNPKEFIADTVYVKSHTEGENIGGDWFDWDSVSTEPDDDGTTVQITGVPIGRYKRRIESNNEYDAAWWGAKGDNGTTDNLAKILAAEAALPSTGGTVIIRPIGLLSQYSVSDSVNFERSNTTLVIEKGAELFCENDTTDGHTFAFIERTTAQQIENVHIRGGGSIWNTAPGSNENAIGFARCKNYSCVGMKVPQSNKKGITAQVDCDNGYIAFNEIGTTGGAGIAVEGDSQGATQENDTCFIDSNTIENAGAQGINVSFVAGPTTKRVRTRNNIVKLSSEQGMAFSGVDDLIHEGGDTVLSSLGRGFSYLQCVDISGEIRTENADIQGVSLDTCSGEIDLDIYVDFASRNNVGVYDAILVNSPGSTHKITPYVKGTAHKATLNSTDAAAFPVHLLDPVIVNGGTSQTFLGTAPIIGTDNRSTRISVTNNATSIDTILSELFNVSNTVATNVSNLTNGYAEKKVELYFGNGNTTLVHGSGNLRLKGAINVTPTAGQIIILRFISGLWFEVSRNF